MRSLSQIISLNLWYHRKREINKALQQLFTNFTLNTLASTYSHTPITQYSLELPIELMMALQ